MSKLKYNRERLNLTQEELAEKSGVSVRTIQRIEAGTTPKGYTLKVLAESLGVPQSELLTPTETVIETAGQAPVNDTLLKLINLSSLPVCFLPPVNIALPLFIMFIKKEFSPMAKQLVSVQILWTVLSFVIFMLSAFLKNWYSLGNKFSLVVMVLLVVSNMAIIFINAAALDKRKALRIQLKFSLI